ncbi:hypothetical protein MN608_06617 [Microdochium nivale]|nr:hypothetical protein MN608_06617 [Microdochium nivale]
MTAQVLDMVSTDIRRVWHMERRRTRWHLEEADRTYLTDCSFDWDDPKMENGGKSSHQLWLLLLGSLFAEEQESEDEDENEDEQGQ